MPKYVTLTYRPDALSDRAQMLLNLALAQGWPGPVRTANGDHLIVLHNEDNPGDVQVLRIKVRSTIAFSDRCRRFGLYDLEPDQIEPSAAVGFGVMGEDASVPSAAHLVTLIKQRGGDYPDERYWSMLDCSSGVVGRLLYDMMPNGETALHELAIEFSTWRQEGAWAPAHLAQLGGEAWRAILVHLTAGDIDYLRTLTPTGDPGNGIRHLIAQARGEGGTHEA